MAYKKTGYVHSLNSLLKYLEINPVGKDDEQARSPVKQKMVGTIIDNYNTQIARDIVNKEISDLRKEIENDSDSDGMNEGDNIPPIPDDLPIIPIMAMSPEIFEFFKYMESLFLMGFWNISIQESESTGQILVQFDPVKDKNPRSKEGKEQDGKKPRKKRNTSAKLREVDSKVKKDTKRRKNRGK